MKKFINYLAVLSFLVIAEMQAQHVPEDLLEEYQDKAAFMRDYFETNVAILKELHENHDLNLPEKLSSVWEKPLKRLEHLDSLTTNLKSLLECPDHDQNALKKTLKDIETLIAGLADMQTYWENKRLHLAYKIQLQNRISER